VGFQVALFHDSGVGLVLGYGLIMIPRSIVCPLFFSRWVLRGVGGSDAHAWLDIVIHRPVNLQTVLYPAGPSTSRPPRGTPGR